VKRLALLLFLLSFAACGSDRPSIHETGQLPPGGALVVTNGHGNVDAFAPAVGQPKSQWTFEGFGPGHASVVRSGNVIHIAATDGGDLRELVRDPNGVTLTIATRDGAIHVEDVDAVVNASTSNGDIKMLVPQYANAKSGDGNVSVTFGSTSWKGTLHFSADRGDVELFVNENAAATLHLHTDRGTIFTDFPIRGHSKGTSETIDAPINGGASRAIDVHVKTGSIRVLQLKPQM
jgi:hypothetical protein